MRCPKCQYLGFEPSPRCKNCGYDFSFGEDTGTLTLVTDPEAPTPSVDVDLQILDDAPGPETARRGFDLDELLANGRAGSEPMPVTFELQAEPEAPVAALAAVAVSSTPTPEEVERIVREAARVFDEPVPAVPVAPAPPVASAPASPVAPVATEVTAAKVPEPVTTELPLFMQGMSRGPAIEPPATTKAPVWPAPDAADDLPLVVVPARPRAPLSVRRTTPDAASLRAKYARPVAPASVSGDLLRDIDLTSADTPAAADEPPATRRSAERLTSASTAARLGAASIDAVLLAAVNALVIWLTLSVCELTASDVSLLPVVPLAVFFVVLDGGYLVLFTAACGQTLGKMVAGIRVVGTTTGAVSADRPSIGQAFARALSALASVVPLGAGFWMALAGDRRALHDRIAHTRVVRA